MTTLHLKDHHPDLATQDDASDARRRSLRRMPSLLALAALLCGMLGLAGCATSGNADAWPTKLVSADQLQLAEPLQIRMPRRNLNDPMPSGVTVLRLHVDERGTVRKTLLDSSSGSAALDVAAAQTLTGARFVPYRESGVAMAVTTLMPLNVRASAQCRGTRPLDC